MLVAVICGYCLVSTCIFVIVISSSSKPNSGVTGITGVFIVTKETNSCFWSSTSAADSVESFLITVGLQGRLWTNKRLPLVATQSGRSVKTIRNQWVEGTGLLEEYNELFLVSDFHSQADLWEGCVPVGWKLSLMCVDASLPSWKVEIDLVAPKFGTEVKGWLWWK